MKLCQCQATYLHFTNETVPIKTARSSWASPGKVFCPYCAAAFRPDYAPDSRNQPVICWACGGGYRLLREQA